MQITENIRPIPDRPDCLYKTPGRVALVLAGGAARGAYEVGVIQHLLEEVPRDLGRDVPLDILCGTSIGAVNGCALAAFADAPRSRARRLLDQWLSLQMEDVVRLRPLHLARFVRSLVAPSPLASEVHEEQYGGLIEPRGIHGILSNAIPFARIEQHLQAGLLQAVTVSATHISTGNTVVFVARQNHGIPRWSRDPKVVPRRVKELRLSHALASAAIPLVFPSVRIDGEFYCDGGLRQNVPLSPARHLGANGVIVVSPRFVGEIQKIPERANPNAKMPSPLFLIGKALNALLLDRVENDIERLQRINQILLAGDAAFGSEFVSQLNHAMGYHQKHDGLRPLPSLLVRASENIGKMAVDYVRSPTFAKRTQGPLAKLVRVICEMDAEEESDLLSYLLFDGEFARQLIDLGRRDARSMHADFVRFFTELPPDLGLPKRPKANSTASGS